VFACGYPQVPSCSSGPLVTWPRGDVDGIAMNHTSSSSSSALATITRTSTATITNPLGSESCNARYTRGTIVGIGLGLGLPLVIASLAAVFFAFKWSQTHKAKTKAGQGYGAYSSPVYKDTHDAIMGGKDVPHHHSSVHEVGNDAAIAELPIQPSESEFPVERW